MELKETTHSLTEVITLLQEWEDAQNLPHYNIIPTLAKLASELEQYFNTGTDPFDEPQPLLQIYQDGLMKRLIKWATDSIEPLQSYATGVLAAGMKVPEIAIAYKNQNDLLYPLMLQRLRALQTSMSPSLDDTSEAVESKRKCIKLVCDTADSGVEMNLVTKQIVILRYLTSLDKDYEFMCHAFEHNALELILWYVNIRETNEARLGFEALKFLAVLFRLKVFSIDFMERTKLECLLNVPQSSIANPGVSLCLYSLAHCEEAMERVCLLPKPILHKLIKYELWLLESPHDSIRCHGIIFFGIAFQFRAILQVFDIADGLRKLRRVNQSLTNFNEDIVGHVCVAYKRYLETHLNIKIENLMEVRLQGIAFVVPRIGNNKAYKPSAEKIQEQIESLIQWLNLPNLWQPVDQLIQLGEITWLLKACSSTRVETVRNALDVLSIAYMNFVMGDLTLSKNEAMGMNIIIEAAVGKIGADPDVQKSALRVITNCVCVPINCLFNIRLTHSNEFLQKFWESFQMNKGIMVLQQLLNVQTPVLEADCIRALACKALACLARSEPIRDIICKHSIITAEHLQTLMRDPISQQKRHEHVQFQNYALELLKRLGTNEVTIQQQPLELVQQYLSKRGLNETAATKKLSIEKCVNNIAVRSARNQMGYESYAFNRHFIHSRFYPVMCKNSEFYTSVKFLPGNESFLLGFSSGEVRIVKTRNANEQSSFFTYDNYFVEDMEPNRDATLLLTSNGKMRNFSTLWSLNGFEQKLALHNEERVEFSKTLQDRVIGTREGLATIYDLNSGVPITRLLTNIDYEGFLNKATFSPNDDLVLCNSVLYDVRIGQKIHKLDKINRGTKGVFHPNELEIVTGTNVRDIRTYRLLRIVPVLQECILLFAPLNSVIYATPFNSATVGFVTVDSSDYSTIATVYDEAPLMDLDINEYDTQLAVIECHLPHKPKLKLYDVGRKRDEIVRQGDQGEEDPQNSDY